MFILKCPSSGLGYRKTLRKTDTFKYGKYFPIRLGFAQSPNLSQILFKRMGTFANHMLKFLVKTSICDTL